MPVSKRLKGLFERANEKTMQQGLAWYLGAHKEVVKISNETGFSIDRVSAVVAILSPAVTWEQNLRDARVLCLAVATGGQVKGQNTTVSTYGANKLKAIDILMGFKTFEPTKTNMKTYNFYKNIAYPSSPKYCTIDRHAIKALKGIKKGGSVSVSPKSYKLAQEAYTRLAKELNILPHQAQAVVWTQYKIEMGR